MKENLNNMIYIDSLREKLGIAPKKCVYEIVNGEIVIYNKEDLFSA